MLVHTNVHLSATLTTTKQQRQCNTNSMIAITKRVVLGTILCGVILSIQITFELHTTASFHSFYKGKGRKVLKLLHLNVT